MEDMEKKFDMVIEGLISLRDDSRWAEAVALNLRKLVVSVVESINDHRFGGARICGKLKWPRRWQQLVKISEIRG